jgi:phosphate transport system substrate-binding protein
VALLAVVVGTAGLTAAPAVGQQATPEAGAAIVPYAPETPPGELEGQIIIDGSSTVWPITAEVAERFVGLAEDVRIEVEISGTGGGFRRFCDGESDLQNASRPITPDEAAACAENGVGFYAFEVGFDGISVVVNPDNDFVGCLTVDQLRRLWRPDDPARTWRDLDPAWPADEIELYGPGPDSGTFDYFTEAIVGEEGASRVDYFPSENDAVLVEEVSTDVNALGYFGYAYYLGTQDRLRAVPIDNGGGCVAPSPETIADGSYAPLSRPLYVYVSQDELGRPAVREFLRYYLATARDAVATVGYVPSPDATYAANQAKLDGAIAGSVPPETPPIEAIPTP